MSCTTVEEVARLKTTDAFVIASGNGRRLNLESVDCLDVQGYDSEQTKPQTASITCAVILASYGNDYKISANITYSAPIPSDWLPDTDIETAMRFVREASFDVTVRDVALFKVRRPVMNLQGSRGAALSNIEPLDVARIIKHKMLGELPSDTGFDDYLASEIDTIFRDVLFHKITTQIGKYATSARATKDIVGGMSKKVSAAISGGLDYQLLTTDSEQDYNPLVCAQKSARLTVALSGLMMYEAGYNIKVDMVFTSKYPDATPPFTKDRDIRKFLDKADFSCRVVHAELLRNADLKKPPSTGEFLEWARAFNKEEAKKSFAYALNNPNQVSGQMFAKAIDELLKASKQSIAARMKYGSLHRLDTI